MFLDTFALFFVVLLLGVGLEFIKALPSSSLILYLFIHFTIIFVGASFMYTAYSDRGYTTRKYFCFFSCGDIINYKNYAAVFEL